MQYELLCILLSSVHGTLAIADNTEINAVLDTILSSLIFAAEDELPGVSSSVTDLSELMSPITLASPTMDGPDCCLSSEDAPQPITPTNTDDALLLGLRFLRIFSRFLMH